MGAQPIVAREDGLTSPPHCRRHPQSSEPRISFIMHAWIDRYVDTGRQIVRIGLVINYYFLKQKDPACSLRALRSAWYSTTRML